MDRDKPGCTQTQVGFLCVNCGVCFLYFCLVIITLYRLYIYPTCVYIYIYIVFAPALLNPCCINCFVTVWNSPGHRPMACQILGIGSSASVFNLKIFWLLTLPGGADNAPSMVLVALARNAFWSLCVRFSLDFQDTDRPNSMLALSPRRRASVHFSCLFVVVCFPRCSTKSACWFWSLYAWFGTIFNDVGMTFAICHLSFVLGYAALA